MEEVGAQVAPPIFLHQALPGRFREAPSMAKKRDLPWLNPNFQQQQQQQQERFNSAFQNPRGNWNPKIWDWDSVRFVAKPSENEILRSGTADVVDSEQKKKGEETVKPVVSKKSSVDEDGENLTLKLGGSLYSVEEAATRPNKRIRSGSPGGGNYPMCQVDDCRGDLSNAKDYHRRHKVCELHSKTTKALVGNQMQRFCQQCSRFHPLSEFDEGKRSCRRRLAGHNRRRRKTQPEDVSSRLLLPGSGNQENSGKENLEIVNLLTILARLQGNNVIKSSNGPPVPDRDRLIQILSKMNSLPVAGNSAAKLSIPGSFDLNVAQVASENINIINGNSSSPSTMDLLAVLSAALAASPDALAILSQRSSNGSNDDKAKLNCLDQSTGLNIQNKPIPGFPSFGGEHRNGFRSPVAVTDCQVQDARPSLPLQLFSSSPEDNSPLKLRSDRKYFSSDSSNLIEERSPSSSPVVQKLFPLQTATEIMKHERMSSSGEDNVTVEASTTHGWSSPLELFKGSNGRVENCSVQSIPYQAGYTSSSGSDRSPSSSNSGSPDRTGRIIFKLFDKDPSNFPGTLRTQILNWLSHSPSEMESYIRPGCVVLSVYVSMSSIAWEQLQEELLQRVNVLIRDLDSDFWRDGRFLVHTDRQLISHKDGKIRLCKSWRTWSAPELISVSPLAVVGGQETSLLLRGRNLTVPGTKIHCTYKGGYISKEVSESAYQGTLYDDTSLESFNFPGFVPGVWGRCFIEVDNGFKGNSFPVIIADATICRELRLLESEFAENPKMGDVLDDQIQDFGQARSREDILHFLNELGWLFQRKCLPSRPGGSDFSHTRFKFLFTFSVERDWCVLVKTLLDMLMETSLGKDPRESLETLSDVHLLNRAVKRKCKNMVNLLIHYSINSCNGASKKYYLFPPNLGGPGGITPLHLAASTQGSEDMVDALTSDPQQIGLSSWNSLPDANGQSPYAYAATRNNHSYNRLVARKIADRKNSQVSIPVRDEIFLDQSWITADQTDRQCPQPRPGRNQSCARCSTAAMRHYKRMPAGQGLLHRPYVHSMLAIAAVCVCVCLFLRGSPDIGRVAPFKWENLVFGTM